MGTPAKHLPGIISDDAINELLAFVGLPKASKILPANVTAEYHSIYIITLPLNNKAAYKPGPSSVWPSSAADQDG